MEGMEECFPMPLCSPQATVTNLDSWPSVTSAHSRIFFTPFLEADDTCDIQVVMCDPGPSTACQSPSEVATGLVSPAPAPNIDHAQLSQDREAVYTSPETSLWRLHAINEHNPAYPDIVKALPGELERNPNGNDVTCAMLAMKATVAARRRRAHYIRVQPTSIARRRPGLTRGSKRVPAGRPPANHPRRGQGRDPTLYNRMRRATSPVQGSTEDTAT